MAVLVYVLCALTSLAVALLLLRGWRHSRSRFLLWSGLCFVGLFLNNVLLVIDERIVPAADLAVWRTIPAVIGLAILLYGLVWDSHR